MFDCLELVLMSRCLCLNDDFCDMSIVNSLVHILGTASDESVPFSKLP